MKIQVRRNVFETNSSSIHSIAICKKKNVKYNIPNKLVFDFDNFGWEVNKLYTSEKKASYLYTALQYFDNPEKICEHIKDVCEKNGCHAIFNGSFSGSYNGYIDHSERIYPFIDTLISDDNLLLSYLFGDSYVFTYNNNMSYSDMMYNNEIESLKTDSDYIYIRKGN